MERPKFVIKNRFQKGGLYQDLLKPSTLTEICQKLTGSSVYDVEFDNEGYNIGRLALLYFDGKVFYISFSEAAIRSRNSSFQSLPSALNRYILEGNENKEICFYFLPEIAGNYETPYFNFMYRLMKTANVRFLNADEFLHSPIPSFASPADILIHKDSLRNRNRANKSTYLTTGVSNQLQIFGKTYGANKYETTLLCLAISEIATENVELYEIEEGNLTKLPQKSKEAIESLGIVSIYTSNRIIEKRGFIENDSLRSPEYIYNLLERLGEKKCALCNCDVPQIIQGAHIYPVADIKRENHRTIDEKLALALDGNNGLWLCNNHHKLFDSNIITINNLGGVSYSSLLNETQSNFIIETTTTPKLTEEVLNEDFINYLEKRNRHINEHNYVTI